MITVCDAWLRRLSDKPRGYAIQYDADQDLADLRRFWGAALGTAPHAIRLLRKSNSHQLAGRTWRSRYGVLTVIVHDTMLRSKLQGWMDRLRESWL